MAEKESSADQDPSSRSQKPRREPPVIDLAADTAEAPASEPEQEKPASTAKASLSGLLIPALSGLIGLALGAGLIAAGSSFSVLPNPSGARLDAVEAAINHLAITADAQNRDAKITALEKSVADLKAIRLQPSSTGPDLSPLTARLADLEKRIEASAAAPAASAASDSMIARLTARLGLLAILRARFEHGEPFTRELAALAAIDTSIALPPVLQENAATGVATLQSLASEARTMPLPSAMSAPKSDKQVQSISGTLLGGLEKFVTITPLDHPEIKPPNTVDALRDALASQDLQRALALSQQNHGPSPYDQLIRSAKTRLDAELAIEALENQTVSAIAAEAVR